MHEKLALMQRYTVRVRNAILPDVAPIHSIIELYCADGTLLPRQLAELYENVRDFMVAEYDGKVIGCGALHFYGLHLAEVRSIAVHPDGRGLGAGCMLVRSLMQESKRHKVDSVCLFTRIPEFFARMGFSVASRQDLPDKVYKDCIHCPRFHACNEIAMIYGQIPEKMESTMSSFACPSGN